MRLGRIVSVALCLVLAGQTFAQRSRLSVGDPAPGLDVESWAKGGPVTLESGKVYVVEFWATWCIPCRKSIPHLTELQKAHGHEGLVVIGVSEEPSQTVERFVTRQGDRMDYNVAIDRRSSTTRAWMNAAGLRGIPAAFVVDRDGRVAYIGHPLADEFDSTLKRVLRGRYNPKLEAQAGPILEAARRARAVKNWRMARLHFEEVIDLDDRVFADVAIELFDMQLHDMNDAEAAYTYARQELVDKRFADDPAALRMLAEKIITDPRIEGDENRDLALARQAAEAALARTGPDEPRSLATLARVLYHLGDVRKAIEYQTQAYFVARPAVKEQYKRVLRTYQEAADRASLSRKG